MTKIDHEIIAACPPERVWALLSNLEAVQQYNPAVRHAAIAGAQRKGVGARRSCELSPKGRVVERVTQWEEGRAVGLELDDHDWPLNFMRWVTRIEPHPEGTRITQTLEYQVRFGPIGWLLDKLMFNRKLTASIDAVFASLARHAERQDQDLHQNQTTAQRN